jgi:hypothetical protein
MGEKIGIAVADTEKNSKSQALEELKRILPQNMKNSLSTDAVEFHTKQLGSGRYYAQALLRDEQLDS